MSHDSYDDTDFDMNFFGAPHIDNVGNMRRQWTNLKNEFEKLKPENCDELLENTEDNNIKITELVGKVSDQEKQLKTIDESVEKLAEQTEGALRKIEERGNSIRQATVVLQHDMETHEDESEVEKFKKDKEDEIQLIMREFNEVKDTAKDNHVVWTGYLTKAEDIGIRLTQFGLEAKSWSYDFEGKKTEISALMGEIETAKKYCEDEEKLGKLENLCKAVESYENGLPGEAEKLKRQKAEATKTLGLVRNVRDKTSTDYKKCIGKLGKAESFRSEAKQTLDDFNAKLGTGDIEREFELDRQKTQLEEVFSKLQPLCDSVEHSQIEFKTCCESFESLSDVIENCVREVLARDIRDDMEMFEILSYIGRFNETYDWLHSACILYGALGGGANAEKLKRKMQKYCILMAEKCKQLFDDVVKRGLCYT